MGAVHGFLLVAARPCHIQTSPQQPSPAELWRGWKDQRKTGRRKFEKESKLSFQGWGTARGLQARRGGNLACSTQPPQPPAQHQGRAPCCTLMGTEASGLIWLPRGCKRICKVRPGLCSLHSLSPRLPQAAPPAPVINFLWKPVFLLTNQQKGYD